MKTLKNLPTPKNKGAINTAFPGETHCKRTGSIQALNVNSSENGATT